MEFMKSKLKVSFPLMFLLLCLIPFIHEDPMSYGLGMSLLMGNAESDVPVTNKRFIEFKKSKVRRFIHWSANAMLITLIAIRLFEHLR